MSSPTRRGAIGIVLGAGVGLGLCPVAALAQGRIVLPEGPHILSRRIERSLSDGEWISVDRSWQVEFSRQAQGISISGQQVDVEIKAPTSLAPIAAIEQARSTAEMWPMLLNASGMLFGAGVGISERDLSAAVEAAQSLLAERPAPASVRAQRLHYLASMQRAGSSLLDQLPDDLFFPTIGPMHAVRPVELPGGMTGEFELSYSAVAVPEKGWLDRAQREVITRLAGTQKIAREHWAMRQI